MDEEKPIEKSPCEEDDRRPAACMDCSILYKCDNPQCERAKWWKKYRMGWKS